MAVYLQITVTHFAQEQQEIIMAALMNIGYEGIEETETALNAFIPENDFDEKELIALQQSFSFQFAVTTIPEQNWNAVWESNFEPVVVDDFVAVRAGFHAAVSGVEHEIVITPKMSFGTGHHATTYMMVQQMREINFKDKKVFDFGTGTGILAILAEKRGALSVFAIDNDEWSINNAAENINTNHCTKIKLEQADTVPQNQQYDILLANINKNVILENLQALKLLMNKGAILLLSGLLKEDENDIHKAAEANALRLTKKQERNNWICLEYQQ